MARYEAGETLASIARTYDCSPPAISYIVSRSRTRPAAEAAPAAPTAEAQLVKAPAVVDTAVGDTAAAAELRLVKAVTPGEPVAVEPVAIERAAATQELVETDTLSRRSEVVANGGGAPPVAAGAERRNGAPEARIATNGEPRRKLHLSLGNGGYSNTNGRNGYAAEPAPPGGERGRPGPEPASAAGPKGPEPLRGPPRVPPMPEQQRRYDQQFATRANGGHDAAHRAAEPGAARRADAGSFIDQELRTRVDGDIAAFLAAFDAALAEDTQESRFGLREATDRLLRAGARTRIELERLEARLPLPPRDGGSRPEAAVDWRVR